jgi:hypothetical protein
MRSNRGNLLRAFLGVHDSAKMGKIGLDWGKLEVG